MSLGELGVLDCGIIDVPLRLDSISSVVVRSCVGYVSYKFALVIDATQVLDLECPPTVLDKWSLPRMTLYVVRCEAAIRT